MQRPLRETTGAAFIDGISSGHLLRRRLRCLSTLLTLMHACLHGLELLLLGIVQSCLDLAFRVLLNYLHLGMAVGRGERLILPELLHLLIAVFKNWLDLRLLVGSQIQLLGKVLQLRIGIHPVMPVALPLLRRGIILSKSGTPSH